MKQTTLCIMLICAVTIHECLGQSSKDTSRQHKFATKNNSVLNNHADSVNVCGGWLRSGLSANGIWLGTLSPLALHLSTNGVERISIQPSGKVSVTNSIDIKGTTTTEILTVTGGADLAEPFEIDDQANIPEGAVVIIDEVRPGKLKLSETAYDTRVAGVVSGAGGIRPGLTLRQNGKLSEGLNVTLVGRAYVLTTAANGSIKPGDLLTTSDIQGHAMKAADKESSQGAIIGKALTPLEIGEDLVLV